jgi:hypothetical protein
MQIPFLLVEQLTKHATLKSKLSLIQLNVMQRGAQALLASIE